MKRAHPTIKRSHILLNLLMLAAGTELAQSQLAGRTPGWGDLMIDMTGGLGGVWIQTIPTAAYVNIHRPARKMDTT